MTREETELIAVAAAAWEMVSRAEEPMPPWAALDWCREVEAAGR